MNEQLQVIGLFGQLGLGGVMLTIALVLWSRTERWKAEQEARMDRQVEQFAKHQEKIVQVVMDAVGEHVSAMREAASSFTKAASDLRIVTDRLNGRGA